MIDDFWELICAFRTLYLAAAVVVFVLGSLSLLAYPASDPGSATRAIIQINAVLQVLLLAVFGGLYWQCGRV